MAREFTSLDARLYLDQDVPVRLAPMLRAHGLDAITTLDAGALGETDDEQLTRAVDQGRVLVTHNRLHFEDLHCQYLTDGRTHYGILIAPQRRDVVLTRDRILDTLNRLDRDQLRNQLLYV